MRFVGHRRVVEQGLQAVVDGARNQVVEDFEGVGLALAGGVGHVALGGGYQLGVVEARQQAEYALVQQAQLVVEGAVQGRAVVGYQAAQQPRRQLELFAQQGLHRRGLGRHRGKAAQGAQGHGAGEQVGAAGQVQQRTAAIGSAQALEHRGQAVNQGGVGGLLQRLVHQRRSGGAQRHQAVGGGLPAGLVGQGGHQVERQPGIGQRAQGQQRRFSQG